MIKIEIWSDVLCPFCFIGYRNLQRALEQFEGAEKVEITWHSFLLNPDMKTDLSVDSATALARAKGQSVEWARQVQQQVADMGQQSGVEFRFDKSITASSLRAHHLIQFAKQHDVAEKVEVALFEAHFQNGENIDSPDLLVKIGAEAGLEKETVLQALEDPKFAAAIDSDVYQARTMGVQGVPFFLFNEKYAVRGAQPADTFLQVLKQVGQESLKEETSSDNDLSCDTDSKSC